MDTQAQQQHPLIKAAITGIHRGLRHTKPDTALNVDLRLPAGLALTPTHYRQIGTEVARFASQYNRIDSMEADKALAQLIDEADQLKTVTTNPNAKVPIHLEGSIWRLKDIWNRAERMAGLQPEWFKMLDVFIWLGSFALAVILIVALLMFTLFVVNAIVPPTSGSSQSYGPFIGLMAIGLLGVMTRSLHSGATTFLNDLLIFDRAAKQNPMETANASALRSMVAAIRALDATENVVSLVTQAIEQAGRAVALAEPEKAQTLIAVVAAKLAAVGSSTQESKGESSVVQA
ncbi:MAG: hypothetical protein KF716_17255 [Anaerolineae bacterium]|nr:hypothetical protein [Anaerolineae bacterium]